ncbi:Protoporphyrinogen oxidase [Trametes punicea]|nr:Protoporphyrinogen oxidase [Trametes punicea]
MLPPRSVTIIGGGLSGLSAAFHLSRRFPPHSGARITLVEKSNRLGGWVHSERVRVKDQHGRQADVLLESGPRTLRPTSRAVLEIIHLLDLSPSLITVSRKAPAAQNRFLHIPGTTGLVTIPGSVRSLLVSPLAKVLVPALLKDFRRRDGKVLNVSHPNDESVDAFLTRHFGAEFSRTFGSALVHGIYAADSRILSVRAAFSALCRLEEKGRGSAVRGLLNEMMSSFRTRKPQIGDAADTAAYHVGDVPEMLKGASVYSFHDGMQTLTDAMARHLEQQENVTVLKGDGAVALAKTDQGDRFQVTTSSGKTIVSSHIISAIPLSVLYELLAHSFHSQQPPTSQSPTLPSSPSPEKQTTVPIAIPPFPHPALSRRIGIPGRYQGASFDATEGPPTLPSTAAANIDDMQPLPPLPHLLANPSSSVTLVNLVFPPSHKPIHPDGFGYLIPRPQTGYPSSPRSALGILGTVFDSCALGGQDVSISADQRSPKFTKITVMLGGPYGCPSPDPQSPPFLPALLTSLREHLGHDGPLPPPCLVRIRQHRDCIPTPAVGHVERMEELRAAVKEQWGRNAAVIGTAVDGVSVGDCIESGRRAALEL